MGYLPGGWGNPDGIASGGWNLDGEGEVSRRCLIKLSKIESLDVNGLPTLG